MMNGALFVIEEVQFTGTGYGHYSIANAQFAIDLTRVEFDSAYGQDQFVSYFLIR
jgi:hypothetical protein